MKDRTFSKYGPPDVVEMRDISRLSPSHRGVRVTITACLLFLTSAFAAADKSSQLDQLMQRYHELGQFNGVALVIDNGSTVLREGYGFANMDWQVQNTPETRFLVGSITKSFTALVIMQLVEQGKLDLDATVSKYLPAYRADMGSTITLRHLLAHTDGIPSYTKNTYFWQSYENDVPYSTSEFVARYCSGDAEFEPGSQYRYGNSGYSILGAIIEQVTGESYGETVARQVLRPLDMKNTGQSRHDTNLDKRASGYDVAIGGFRPAAPIYKSFLAAGSMYATVDDLVLYARALQGVDLISKPGKAMLFESREGAVDGTFAFGWNVGESTLGGAIDSRHYVATNGQVNGFNAVMMQLPEDGHLIVLLNNTGETELFAMATNIMRILYDLAPEDPVPQLRDVFYNKLQNDSLNEAIAFYRRQREDQPRNYIFFPWPIRILAGQLLADGRHDDAITLLELNLETNPNDAKSFASLGQAYLQAGDVKKALGNFDKALSLDSSSEYVADMLQNLKE